VLGRHVNFVEWVKYIGLFWLHSLIKSYIFVEILNLISVFFLTFQLVHAMKNNIFYIFICFLLACGSIPLQSNAQVTINQLTGINVKSKDPVSPMSRFSLVRVFHDWSQDIGFSSSTAPNCPSIDIPADWQLQWNPSTDQSGPFLSFDQLYSALNTRAVPVLKGIAPSMRGHTYYPAFCGSIQPLEQKPFCLKPNQSFNQSTGCDVPGYGLLPDPQTGGSATGTQEHPDVYQQHAMWLSLFAARYGPGSGNGWTANFVNPYLNTNQTGQVIGQNKIAFLEDKNEPNKAWYDQSLNLPDLDFITGKTHFYFSPDQLRAMFQADYDGAGNSLQVNGVNSTIPIGVINASPGLSDRFVKGGLATLCHKYDEAIGFAEGIKNFHHYCTASSALQQDVATFNSDNLLDPSAVVGEGGTYNAYFVTPTGQGVCPEADKFKEKLRWTGMDYWLSEFGYDSNPSVDAPAGAGNGSGVDVPIITGEDGTFDVQKVQAQWLLRGVLEAAASGSVTQMMLYELRDEPQQGNNSYAYSGLLTAAGAAKRSWYYVMTLKHVLGEYVFEQEITDGVGGFEVSTTDNNSGQIPRVYEFIKGNERIFVLWSPTQQAYKYTCDLTFPSGQNIYIVNDKATLIHIQEMSETGRKEAWTDINGQTVRNIPITETPIFLKIRVSEGGNYAQPVSQLSASPACCQSVELTWRRNGLTRNTLIFYQKTNGTCPAFDFTKATLFTNYTGPNRTRITVTGLEPNTNYCFWVFPIQLQSGLPQADLQQVGSVITTATTDCADCLIAVSPAEITLDPGYPVFNPTGRNALLCQVNQLMGTGIGDLSCADTRSGVPNDPPPVFGNCPSPFDPNVTVPYEGWTYWQDPNPSAIVAPNTFTITFATPKRIDALYAEDVNGNGTIKIEYRDCRCRSWSTLTTLNLDGTTGLPASRWIHLSNLNATGAIIKQLRITKLQPGANVRRLRFCGADVICPPGSPGRPQALSDLRAEEIGVDITTLRWTPIQADADDPTSPWLEQYELRISQQLDQAGQLANPVTYQVQADPMQYETFQRLSGLAPGTLYYAELTPLQGPDCVYPEVPPSDNKVTTQFTTLSQSGERSLPPSSQRTDKPFLVRLSPNPAGASTQASISEGLIDRVETLTTTGQRVGTVRQVNASSVRIDLSTLPTAIYWLRVYRTDGLSLTVHVVHRQ
jgi:hypothetical protein